MKDSIVIFGPQGCGKTRNAKKLASYFGLTQIVDADDEGISELRGSALILTNGYAKIPPRFRRISYESAMRQAGLK